MTLVESLYEKYRSETWRDLWLHLPFLRQVARGRILEIGVHVGTSTSALLLGLADKDGHLFSVDSDPICPAPGIFGNQNKWTFISSDSKNTREMPEEIFQGLDVLLIDGDHTYDGVTADIHNYLPLLNSGGVMLMHDVDVSPRYPTDDFPGVQKAFAEVCAAHPGWESYMRKGCWGLGVLEKP
jgi:predicted O-methyltransferase YrrM